MPRKCNITSPEEVEIVLIPNAEKVREVQKRAAPEYRRSLLKKIKQLQSEEDKSPA